MSRRAGSSNPRCAVGLLTWNGARDVVECVRSLLAQTELDFEIIWIDNASTDSTVALLRSEFPELPDPIALDENIGFCGGHNLGLAQSSAPYYFALNQDAFLAPDYLTLLCDWLDDVPELAMVSGLILDPSASPNGEKIIHSAGVAISRGRFPFELGMGRAVCPQDKQMRIVPGVTGAAMLLRHASMDDVADESGNGFPPEYFAYYEEIDLALRLNQAGYQCGVHGEAVAVHAARGQGGRGNSEIRRHYFKNFWLTVFRNAALGDLVRDFAPILKTYLLRIFPQQLRYPGAALSASVYFIRNIGNCARHRRRLEKKYPDAPVARREVLALSARLLEEDRRLRQSVSTQTDSSTSSGPSPGS